MKPSLFLGFQPIRSLAEEMACPIQGTALLSLMLPKNEPYKVNTGRYFGHSIFQTAFQIIYSCLMD